MIKKQNLLGTKRGRIEATYEFNPGLKIGSGAFGTVFKARLKGTKQQRAIKRIPKSQVSDPRQLFEEIKILQRLDHPNIARLYESFQDDKFVYVVMELCTGGELFDRIIERGQFSEYESREVILCLILALRHCHQNGIIHRDVKPQNMLLEHKGDDSHIKLIDFGLAKKFKAKDLPKKRESVVGSSYYIAPEVFQLNYGPHCDVWSAGVILYILLTGQPPFGGEDDDQIMKAIKKGVFSLQPLTECKVSKEAIDLIRQMLVMDHSKRIRTEGVLAHPWFKEVVFYQPLPFRIDNFRRFSLFNPLKKLAISMLATQLTGKEIEDLAAVFKSLDTNGDGSLSLEEIRKCISTTKLKDGGDLQAMLKAADTDGSGSISYNEFVAASLSLSLVLEEENLRLMFRMFDLDGNGRISRGELRTILSEYSADSKFGELVEKADKNGDGDIDYEQFLQIMRA